MLPRMALDELETYSAELPTAPAGDLAQVRHERGGK
jgi:hypothetical protein